MNHYIKIHFLEDPDYFESKDYDWRDILAFSYNEALEVLWEEKETFYWDDEEVYIQNCLESWIEPEENERYDEIFTYLWSKDLSWSGRYYCIVRIDFSWISENSIDSFLEYFLSNLKDKVTFLWKFEDTRLLEIRKRFFEEVYNIELQLREVVSFIFFNTYLTENNLLKEIIVKPVIKLEKNKNIKDILQDYENEFFYISFSEYKNLLNLTTLQDKEKTELLEVSSDFDEWKEKIFNRWIKREFYIDFINSIKQDLENLEKFRNSIMHNRWFSNTVKQNYENSKKEILQKIETFQISHMYILWNDSDLVIWNKYTYISDTTKDFIQWKRYELIENWWWYAIFISEIYEKHVRFEEKEFTLYWSWE